MERRVEKAIKENTEYFLNLYNCGELSKKDLEDFLRDYIEEEEFECAASIRDVLKIITPIE